MSDRMDTWDDRTSTGKVIPCSMLYGAAWRATKAMGYRKLITYTLPEEGGASLRAAGWRLIGEAGGGKRSRKERLRVDDHPTQIKLKWGGRVTHSLK